MMNDSRSYEKELLDLGPAFYTKEEYDDCLRQLGRIGRYLGGDRASLKSFGQFPVPNSILDVGCGGGQFTILLGKSYPKAKVEGVDISYEAITFAKSRLEEKAQHNVTFTHSSSPELDYAPDSFDAVTATLVCHHLNDEDLITFLKSSYRIAKQSIVINDLHRHPAAYYSFSLISRLLFPNRLIHHDGLLSIKRSFKRNEWIEYLRAAEIPVEHCKITWHWPFRWMVTIDTSSKSYNGSSPP